jgi:hypothetical protein
MTPRPPTTLPAGVLLRGLNREQAAEYNGVGATKIDQMVTDDHMPKPKRIDARVVGDRVQLDSAFEALPDGNGYNVWSKVTV